MQRRQLLHAWHMNISKNQHVLESILAPTLVAAPSLECLRIFEGAKEHVPERNVREVVCVMTELMMDPMRFWPLENETNPRWRFDIPMIEKFSQRDEHSVISSCADAATEQRIHNQTAQDGIDQNFHRMFVKAGDDFQSTSRMVDLMKCPP